VESEFSNVYEDLKRAAAYAQLDYPGTYYLAFRDIPEIIKSHVQRSTGAGLDFGCGAGRSTRFLAGQGFRASGVDISQQMIDMAHELDPDGDYRLVDDGNLSTIENGSCDVVLSAFTFDNIPSPDMKVQIFRELKRVLAPGGRIISIVSSPELYQHDWASFKCTGFSENFTAKNGESVYTIMTDIPDSRPVQDVRWDDAAYRGTYDEAGLEVDAVYRPLGIEDEPYPWVSETELPPWVVYVLK
jgi:SAM-dependent methyltransferase